VGRWVRGLSPGAEFAVVILGAFGLFFLVELLPQPPSAAEGRITSAQLHFMSVYELVVCAALAAFLAARGFSLKRLGLQPSLVESAVGLALALAMMAAAQIVEILFTALWPHADEAIRQASFTTPGVTIATVATTSIINAIYEEVFVCGYVITVLKDRTDPWTAIKLSAGIRLLYHVYQGPLGMTFVILFGITMAYYYIHRGQLWPPIVAHAVYDFIALLDLGTPPP
jgi:membrane protease YdiL (CAAX protease family)